VKAVVKSAYVDGVHAKADPALMRAGFHPGFRMLVLKDGALAPVTLDEWAARIEKGAAERKGPPPEIRHEFSHVDVTGNAAVVRLELHRGGQAHLHRLPVPLPLPRRLEDRVQDLPGPSRELAGRGSRLAAEGFRRA
jgi:putative lumazine-binding protein